MSESWQKVNRTVATAPEMRELIDQDILTPYRVGASWTSYQGAPFGCHIRWNGEAQAFILGTEFERRVIQDWIQDQLTENCE